MRKKLAIILALVVMITSIPDMNLYAAEMPGQEKVEEDITKEENELISEEEKQKALEEEKQKALEEEKQKALEEEKQKALEEEKQKALEEEKQKALEEEKQEPDESIQKDNPEGITEVNPIDSSTFSMIKPHENGLWTFDVYYVNEDDLYNVHKTNDFNLKYQMEFHNSRDISKEEIEIRIPASLLEDRSGHMILPSQIAVPKGTPAEFTESKVTSFNYFIDEETNELVFFNYKDIVSGSNFAWQIGYQKINVMQIVDGSTWSLSPAITVRGDYPEGEEEWIHTIPLSGDVDTCVNLTRLTKEAYAAAGKDYTPAIYTEKQLAQFVTTEIPEKFKGEENFSQYKYVIWEIEAAGEATQMWSMSLTDESVVVNEDVKGEIVGFSKNPLEEIILENGTTSYVFVKDSTARTISKDNASILVVVAYPADKVLQDTVLKNTVELTIAPKDGLDESQVKMADAEWSYINFFWDPELEGITDIVKGEEKSYKGWLEVYKARSEQEIDTGSFPFRIESWSRQGHGKTHNTDPDAGRYGQRISGTKVRLTTADDFMYAYDSLTQNTTVLNALDYYYTGVDITITERGYDPYEDLELEPTEKSSFSVYVMYGRDEDGNLISEDVAENDLTDKTKWEMIADVPWDESGVLQYSLTSQQLEREPWRVMVLHETTNFYTQCSIDVDVCLRHDSKTLGDMVENVSDYQEVTLTNTSALIAEHTKDDGTIWEYYQEDDGTEGNMYELESLKQNSLKLYDMPDGCYPDRYNATAVISNVGKSAEATKTVKSRNDTQNSVVRLTYTLTAYDGYEVYDGEVISILKEKGTFSPGRNDVVFYDLLPFGVRFDPSADIKVGRITDFSGSSYKTTSKAWSKSQVSLAQEPEIIENYNYTGRTLVKFYIHYAGADAAVLSKSMWLEGWGVEFGAYYEWKDLQYTNPATNLAAFMPEKDDNRALLGGEGDVYLDDGKNSDSDYTVPEEYQIFGKDIDEDGNIEEQTVLYAKATNLDDLVIAAESGIEKFVRAETDPHGIYGKSTAISPGERYTYEITVSNIGEDIQDIYVFDRLENAASDRKNAEQGVFEENWWHGTFENVDVTGLTELGIEPVIYYHASRESAKIPTAEQHPSKVLTEENGWYTSARWEENGKRNQDVQAVTVSLSLKNDGSGFVLRTMESVSFHINMIGPEDIIEGTTYAYNNPSFYSHCEKKDVKQTVIGNTVKVRLEKGKTLEVIKKFDGKVPDEVKDNEFTFSAYYDDQDKMPLAYRKYELYKLVNGVWTIQPGVRATDASGLFYLHADEKAVFTNVKTDLLKVEEKSSIRWETFINTQDLQAQEKKIITFMNRYKPILYVQKEVQGYPERLNITEESFKMKLEQSSDGGVTWSPAADVNYYLVDEVRLGVMEPTILQSGITGSDGSFMIKGGETIALTPGSVDCLFRITEVDSGDAWECVSPTDGMKEVIVPVEGTSVTFVNNYKYKDIYLTKTITHQDAMECVETFGFKITTGEGESEQPLADAAWTLLENGTDTGVAGKTDKNGEFSVDPSKLQEGNKSWADKVIRIEGIEAGTVFTIVETESGEDYRPVNDTVSDRTPIYATSIDVSITNDYLNRPISVTKQLVYDPQGMSTEKLAEAQGMTFEMEITVDGKPYANKNYTVTVPGEENTEGITDEDGKFTIKGGQTVTFEEVDHAGTDFTVYEIAEEDAKYSQIYPLDKDGLPSDIEEVIGNEGSEVTIINGEKGVLLIGKEYIVAEDDNGNGKKYLDEIKTNNTVKNQEAVTLTLEVFDEISNEWKIWPQETVNVNVLDSLTGEVTSSMVLAPETPILIEPWKLLVITDLKDTKYRLKENSEDQYKLYNSTDIGIEEKGFIEISQYEPKDYQPIEADTVMKPYAIIYNQIKGINEESRISKWMTIDSKSVPEDSKLVYIVEKYDGQIWSPAEGIPYIVSTASGEICGEVLTTSADGKIDLYHQGEGKGTPVVSFIEQNVLVNPSESENGTYRIRELIEESDSMWGMLQGYIVDGKEADLDATDANGFINSNNLQFIEIEKVLEEKSSQQFAFILNQVAKTSEGDLISSIAAAGISYEVYNSETDKYIKSGLTGKNGEIYLQGGQYAQIAIPYDTLWTVQEKMATDIIYELKDLSGTEGMTQKLGDNLMLFGDEQQKTYIKATITRSDVTNGVYDARTGAFVNLKAPHVIIPEYIRKTPSGTIMKVTEIGNYAFQQCPSIKSIVMPDSITTLGYDAFRYCANLESAVISGGLNAIRNHSFSGISRNYSFAHCPKLHTVVFNEGATIIGRYMFTGCDVLQNVILPNTIKEIYPYAFSYCDNLKEITIPKSVTKIHSNVFSQCPKLLDIYIVGKAEDKLSGARWGATNATVHWNQ